LDLRRSRYRNSNILSNLAPFMPTFVYRCPNMQVNVQGWVADDPAEHDSYEVIMCLACTRVHLVNPKTGKVLGADDDE
jgi:hypothetical protein